MKLDPVPTFVPSTLIVLAVVVASCGEGERPQVPVQERSTVGAEELTAAAVDEASLARRYVAGICEPFARNFEDAIELGFPEFEGVTSFDDFLALLRQLRAISQRTHDEFSAVQPPAAIRDIHEEVLAVLEVEIAGYQRLETALESGDQQRIEQAVVEAGESATLAGIGPRGFFPTGVPPEYEQAWEHECVPRLNQIPGVEE